MGRDTTFDDETPVQRWNKNAPYIPPEYPRRLDPSPTQLVDKEKGAEDLGRTEETVGCHTWSQSRGSWDEVILESNYCSYSARGE